ncbi:hypothetical protein GCM10017786_74830 [Amycolatopsis deserti]|uniref:Uncharacterized protein n=1 Tax=Amycolatopsis deserti TaxID=185696 RepID=A0ABQ3JGA5_9PSEU|nr:hypothetical protein [Amycolatopsis deserti]GHF29852.1 hypothetical protein GCM10017786_74830 [Amycolatopsis deserti]
MPLVKLMAICDHEPRLLTERPGLLIIADATGQPITRSLTAYDH